MNSQKPTSLDWPSAAVVISLSLALGAFLVAVVYFTSVDYRARLAANTCPDPAAHIEETPDA